MRWSPVLVLFLVSTAVGPAQSVISVRSGLINYSEGAVFIDNQLVAQKLGKYPAVHEGSDLLTHDGRAEILLTPETYLRVGRNSGVRMLSSSLADTRIQLLQGSVILDSGNAKAGAPITLLAAGASIRVDRPTRMRVDVDAAQLRVEKGEAIVEHDGKSTKVAADQMLALTGTSIVRRMNDADDDELDLWSQQRNRLIFLSLANDRNILDPGSPDYGTGAGDADLNAWLGYLPPAAILPLTGTYDAVPLPGYGYYSPWSTLAFYGPAYGRYPWGYPAYGFGAVRGLSVGAGFRSTPGYRYTPITPLSPLRPGGIGTFTPRPVGGIRLGPPSGPGISVPRPSAPASRPVIGPHLPVRR